MGPLDLRDAPPRKPRAELAGVVFLARSVDKLRATLPGGNLGLYTIPGVTTLLLEHLGISVADITENVRTARTDEEVAEYVAAHARPGSIQTWNAQIRKRIPQGGDRAKAVELYPFLADRAELGLSLDVIEEDDRRTFSL